MPRPERALLTIAYEIIERGINDIIVRELVPLAVLQSFYGGAFRGSVKWLRYQNTAQGTEDVVPLINRPFGVSNSGAAQLARPRLCRDLAVFPKFVLATAVASLTAR